MGCCVSWCCNDTLYTIGDCLAIVFDVYESHLLALASTEAPDVDSRLEICVAIGSIRSNLYSFAKSFDSSFNNLAICWRSFSDKNKAVV